MTPKTRKVAEAAIAHIKEKVAEAKKRIEEREAWQKQKEAEK